MEQEGKYLGMLVANYVISCCEDEKISVNHLKLQKLLYYLQARFLVEKNECLINSSFSKWFYGAVNEEVYNSYKKTDGKKLYKKDKEKTYWVKKTNEKRTEELNFLGFIQLEYDESEISDDDKVIIIDTVKKLQKYTGMELTEKIKNQNIWRKDSEYIPLCKPKKYTNTEIREYFLENVEEQLWKKEENKVSKIIKLDEKEEFREYVYANEDICRIENVVAIQVQESGEHRIYTEDGLVHIPRSGWVQIIVKQQK